MKKQTRDARRTLSGIKQLRKGVKPIEAREEPPKEYGRTVRAPIQESANVVEERMYAHLGDVRKTNDFKTITIYGSKGQEYKVVVPASYVNNVPKVWEWTAERYRVAELIAQGIPFTQIKDYPGVTIKSRMTIYCWLEHPEFKSHVDGLILETGWANRRERLSKLTRLNEILLNKVVNELDKVQLSDKMAGALLTAINANAKLISQEKGEFIEESKVTQDTTITGSINVTTKLEDMLHSKTDEEREALEREFDQLGDKFIRAMTGEKD